MVSPILGIQAFCEMVRGRCAFRSWPNELGIVRKKHIVRKKSIEDLNNLYPILLQLNVTQGFFLPGTESKAVEEVRWAAHTWFGVQEQTYRVTRLTGGSLLSILLCHEWTTKPLLTPEPESPNPNNISFIS